MPMDFDAAKDVEVPFGKHRGETIDVVAADDEGLEYLDWMRGECEIKSRRFEEALGVYLDDESIAADLKAVIAAKKSRRSR